jgi:hypothetical protein
MVPECGSDFPNQLGRMAVSPYPEIKTYKA